jgi:cyclase
LRPGVYAARVNFAWTGWVEQSNGILLIDTGTDERSARALADTIRARSGPRPIRYVVNTHAHVDHVAGDRFFASLGATLVAQEHAVPGIERIFTTELAWPATGDSTQPFHPRWIRVARAMTLGKAPRLAQVLWLGRSAHTAGDLLVYLPRQRILFAGDIVSNRSVPWMVDPGMDYDGWHATIDSLYTKRFGVDSLVPGHGWIGTKNEAVGFTKRYLEAVKEQADKEGSWGTKLTDIRDWGDLGQFQGFEFYDEVHFLNLRRLYNEARGIKTPGRVRPSAFYQR